MRTPLCNLTFGLNENVGLPFVRVRLKINGKGGLRVALAFDDLAHLLAREHS